MHEQKQIFISFMVVMAGLLASCATDIDNVMTFGDVSNSSVKGVKVYTDRFAQTKVYGGGKDCFRLDRVTKKSATMDILRIYPRLKIKDGVIIPILEVEYMGKYGQVFTTGVERNYNHMIFLGGKTRLDIHLKVNPTLESSYDSNYKDGRLAYIAKITKSQFDTLSDFLSSNDEISCALYSTNYKAVSFDSFNDKYKDVCALVKKGAEADYPTAPWNESVSDITLSVISELPGFEKKIKPVSNNSRRRFYSKSQKRRPYSY